MNTAGAAAAAGDVDGAEGEVAIAAVVEHGGCCGTAAVDDGGGS